MIDFKKVLEKASDDVAKLLETHEDAIRRSYHSTEEDSFKVSLSIKFTPVGDAVAIETGISFVEQRVKDSITTRVTDQLSLALKEG